MNSGSARSHLAQLRLKPRASVALTFMSARLLAMPSRSPDKTEDNQTAIIIHLVRGNTGLLVGLGKRARSERESLPYQLIFPPKMALAMLINFHVKLCKRHCTDQHSDLYKTTDFGAFSNKCESYA